LFLEIKLFSNKLRKSFCLFQLLKYLIYIIVVAAIAFLLVVLYSNSMLFWGTFGDIIPSDKLYLNNTKNGVDF